MIAPSPGFEESATADYANNIILVLYKEFVYTLIVVLDGAPYFQEWAVTDLPLRTHTVARCC